MSRTRFAFRELRAASLCRPWHPSIFRREKRLYPAAGISVWSDEAYEVGDALTLEVFPGDGTTLELRARVEWVEPQPPRAGAAFLIGLTVSSRSHPERERLQALLAD